MSSDGRQIVDLEARVGALEEDGGGSSAASLPLANQAAGAEPTIDTTTYDDPYTGSGKLTVLVFPAGAPDFGDGALLGVAVEGDAFPRILLSSDMTDGWYFGDGTVDPRGGNAMGLSRSKNNGDGSAVANLVSLHGDLAIGKSDSGGNRGFVDAHSLNGLTLGSGAVMISGGSGEPTCGGEVGDMYIREDGGDGSWIYRCTVAGDAGNATWVAKL